MCGIAGIHDLEDNGEMGFLVKPADAEALASKINESMNNEALWGKMLDDFLSEVKRYFWDNIIRQIKEVYEPSTEERGWC